MVRAARFIQRKQRLQPEKLPIPMHQLPVLVAAKIFAIAEIENTLQKIRLTLAIWPQKNIQRRVQRDRRAVVVAPVPERKFLEDHLTVSAAKADRDSARRSLA